MDPVKLVSKAIFGFSAEEIIAMVDSKSHIVLFLDTTISDIDNIKNGASIDLKCKTVILKGRSKRESGYSSTHVEVNTLWTVNECAGVKRLINDAYIMGCRIGNRDWDLDHRLIVTFDTGDNPIRICARISEPKGNEIFLKFAESHQVDF